MTRTSIPAQRTIRPSILYYGTPVALIATMNPDGTPNLSPMSSSWALDDRIFLGMGTSGQGFRNIERTHECVVNLPSAELWQHVERIAHTTGRDPVPAQKTAMGYRFEPRKFEVAGLTPVPSDVVAPPRVAECPLQLEARVLAIHPASSIGHASAPSLAAIEARVEVVHAHENMTIAGTDHVDVTRWRPLFYLFRHYVAAGEELGSNFRAEV